VLSGQDHERAAVVLGDGTWAWGGHREGVCPDVMRQPVPDFEALPTEPQGSAPELDEVFTPTTRAAPPDPGHDLTVTDYGSGGWGFESLAARQQTRTHEVGPVKR
jgi:hypothetical protein